MQALSKYFDRIKTFGFGVLLMSTSAAWASWMPLGVYGDAATYFDTSSVQTSGQMRKVWTMLDYRQPQYNRANMKFMSTRVLMEIDCAKQLARPRTISYHTKALLQGPVISSEGIFSDWQPIAPSTPVAAFYSQVCKPKDDG